jgi:hypothetical protein
MELASNDKVNGSFWSKYLNTGALAVLALRVLKLTACELLFPFQLICFLGEFA